MSLHDWDAPNWDADGDRLSLQFDHLGQTMPWCADALCLCLALGAHTLVELDATNAYVSRRGWIHATTRGKSGRRDFDRNLERPQASVDLTARDP
jgi:hypothetical protein